MQVVVLPEPCSPTNMTTLGLPFFNPLTLPLPPFLSFSLSFGFGAPLCHRGKLLKRQWRQATV